MARDVARTDAYVVSRCERKKVAMLFAHLKRIPCLNRRRPGTADAGLLNSCVGDVAALVRLSRATLANIHQNVATALGLKAIFLVTTVAGVTGLWPAILVDTGAPVLVTMNALQLLRYRFRAQ